MEKFLTLKEVAEKLSVHRETIVRYIKEGRIPAIKLKRTWRIPEDELEQFTRGRRHKAKK